MERFDVQGNGFRTSSGFCQEVGFCQFLVDVIAVEVLLQQYDGGVYLGKCPVIRFASPEVCCIGIVIEHPVEKEGVAIEKFTRFNQIFMCLFRLACI